MADLGNLFDDTHLDAVMKQIEGSKPPKKPVGGSKEKPTPKTRKKEPPKVEEPSQVSGDPVLSFTLNMTKQEFDFIKESWYDFLNKLNSTIVGQHMIGGINGFVKYMQIFEDFLTKPVEPAEISLLDVDGVRKMTRKKAEILSDIFNQYSKDYEEEEF